MLDKLEGANDFLAGKARQVSGIRVLDDYTLELKLAKPFGPFLSLLSMSTAYVVPKEEVERLGQDFGMHPVGTGPYILGEWKHGQSVTLSARDDYFEGRSSLKGIYYRIIPEDLTAVIEFETGGLDALLIPAPEYRRYTESPKWKGLLLSQVGMNTYYLGMNCERGPLKDPRVRRAVSSAIARARILSTIYEGRGVLAYGPVPRSLLTLPPCCAEPYPYNPESARRLLKEAGYPSGFAMKIYIGADQETLDMVEVVQQYLKAVGIEASIVQLEWSAFKQATNDGEADAFWLSWQADYPDPENFLYPVFYSQNVGSAGNRARFKDGEFDALITKAQSEPDPDRRDKLYREAQVRVVEMAPWVFFWHKKDFLVRQPWIEGYRLYPINNADKGLGIRLR